MAVLDSAKDLAHMTGQREVGELHLLRALLRSQDPLVRSVFGPDGDAAPLAPSRVGSLGSLADHGRILTDEARAGTLDPVVGRNREIQRVIHILGRRRKNNPVLLGEPGVGKTAIVEGLAQAIVDGRVPRTIAGCHLFALDIGSLVAGTKYRGEFESRIQDLLGTVRASDGKIILFIDEMHLIARAGGAEGAINAAGFFKPMLARGELRAVGATTIADYRSHVIGDGALERRFQPVQVREPSTAEAIEMLRGLRPLYEQHHRLTISDAAIVEAVVESDARIGYRHLPDKGIDLVDEAASRLRAEADLAEPGANEPSTPLEVTPEHIRMVIEDWLGGDEGWYQSLHGEASPDGS
jgi:ATP-dependent Clp protease ATP-binding subunit ClpA